MKEIGYYWIGINVMTFAAFGIDKWKAVHGRWRIRESALFGLALLGGAAGGLLGMRYFHHKTKKKQFLSGFPAIFIAQMILFWYFRWKLG